MTGLIHILSTAAALAASSAAEEQPRAGPLAWRQAQAANPLEIPEAPEAAQPAAPEQADPEPGSPPDEDLTQPGPEADDEGTSPDDLSLGEIPVIETMELTPDVARRALDSYLAAKDKYAESDLELYEDLQDFVDQTPAGKNFEADVKAAGFADVGAWNLAITTLGLAYGSIVDDQSADLRLQVEEIKADTELAQDIRDRMIKALEAMIPSENNRKVVEEMMADPAYEQKLKQLDIEEE